MPVLAKAALLGILQGLTEFLPVSSTAHLLIAERLIGYDDPGGVFTAMIQLGSILAVMWLYRQRLFDTALGLRSRPEARRFAVLVAVAALPALVAGALLASYIKNVLYHSFTAFAVAFVAGGVVMLLVEWRRPKAAITAVEQTPVARAFGVGLFQVLALVPGVSRSGATIVGGMVMGLERRAAAELSFFVAIPVMMAVFAHDLLEVAGHLSAARTGEIGVGFVMAFVAALVVIRPFLSFIQRAGFAPFAWYRIVAGVALYLATR